MIAGYIIGSVGYASTFDLLAAVSVAVAIGFMLLVRDPGLNTAQRRS